MDEDGAAAGVTDGAAGVARTWATVAASCSGSEVTVFLMDFLDRADLGAIAELFEISERTDCSIDWRR